LSGPAAGDHQIETAEILMAMARLVVILLAARALTEIMVRLRLPTILGELDELVAVGCGPMPWNRRSTPWSRRTARVLVMVIGTTFPAPVLLGLVLSRQPLLSAPAAGV
jgi:hypothetical protein